MADFRTGLQGLLDTGMLGDIGTGLLANSGWSNTPTTLGQSFGGAMQFANQRQVQRFELQAARQKMEQDKARQDATAKLPGLFAQPMTAAPVQVPTGAPAAIQTPEGRAQAMGLLGQIAPEALTQGLLAQMFQKEEVPRVSTDLNTFKALYPELQEGTPGFREGYLKFTAESDPTGALMDQAQLALLTQELAAARRENENERQTEAESFQTTRRTIRTDLRHLEEMAEINKRLEGTALETGLPLADLRRAWAGGMEALQSVLGNDTRKIAQIKEDFDTFNKYSTDFVVGSLDRLAGGGAITQGKFDALITSNANIGASPGTNNTIIANNIEALLDGADIGGYEIPSTEAQKYRSLIQTLRGGAPAEPNPPASSLLNPALSAPGNEQAEIDALNAQIQELERQIQAAGSR
jgi:hypothetical protein